MELQHDMPRQGSTREMVAPWQYGHQTYTTIKADRPITASEAQWLLDEIARLQLIERHVRSMAYNLRGTRDVCDESLRIIGTLVGVDPEVSGP